MKCKCGGDTTNQRVKITHRGKQYKVNSYVCKECHKQFYFTRLYIPLKGTKS